MTAEFNYEEFIAEHGISLEVAKSVNYTYFQYGATDDVVAACQGFGKDPRSLDGWSKMFRSTDGVIIPAYNQDGSPAMPEIKPLEPVKTGPAKNHYHGKTGDKWLIEDLLILVPVMVLSVYCVYKQVPPPQMVRCADGVEREKKTRRAPDSRKKLVFKHTHSMLTPEERVEHLVTFHGVVENHPAEDNAHSHSIACYKADSKSVAMHVHKGKKEKVDKKYYTPSR